MLQRRLIYTAITRGRRLVVVVGPKKALGIAVGHATARRRWSKLAEWLVDAARPATAIAARERGMTTACATHLASRIDGPRVMSARGPAC